MKGKPFNVLSLDGGGVRGLYTASVLKPIEHQYGPITEGFDMICGTSTGALLGLALSVGRSADEIAKFYQEKGPRIFPRGRWWSRLISKGRQIFTNAYSSLPLYQELVAFFGEFTQMKDCKIPTLAFSYNITKGQPIVFKSPHESANYYRDGRLPIVDVAMATSAAPTYFPNHLIDHENLVGTLCTDGGVWCNNPALAGLLEARTHFFGHGKPYTSVNILSVSTAPKPSGEQFHGGGLLPWQGRLIGSAIQGQSYFADRYLTVLDQDASSGISYRRIEPTNLSTSQMKLLEMDLATDKALQQLTRMGMEDGQDFMTQHCSWISSRYNNQQSNG